MKQGDLVECNKWVHDGKLGIVVEVQNTKYMAGAYVLLDIGIKLISIQNLEVVSEV